MGAGIPEGLLPRPLLADEFAKRGVLGFWDWLCCAHLLDRFDRSPVEDVHGLKFEEPAGSKGACDCCGITEAEPLDCAGRCVASSP